MIAEQQSIPSRYLEEIIGELRKAGFVIGKRGPRGGYRLARPATDIALADILAALGTPSQSNAGAPRDEITRLVEKSVDARFKRAVGEISLAELLGEARDSHRRAAANYMI